jgi:hypothetical protein
MRAAIITAGAIIIALPIIYAFIRLSNLRNELEVCQQTKGYDIRNINIEKTGNYYFQDSILKVEIVVFDTAFRGRVQIPINLNEIIQFQQPYSDLVEEKTIKEIVCKE